MKNQKTLVTLLGAAILAAVVALPKISHADGIDIHAGGVNVDVHDGDHHHGDHHHWLEHVEMDKAINALRDARAHLDHGGHEFGGHRARAIHKADEAINEIKAAIDFANSHEHD
jgi:ABC-type Zn uptake system ZnuABC Zn-binding protein ZnuA